ncbi:MAG TPA: hypothetical protein VHC19_26610 [Pirellulales bacterium]|nr:hypothetical protein [Pirellulales bacterium]
MTRADSRTFRNFFVTYAALAIIASILQLTVGALFGMWLRRDRFAGSIVDAGALMLGPPLDSPEFSLPPLPRAGDSRAGEVQANPPGEAKPRGEPSENETLCSSESPVVESSRTAPSPKEPSPSATPSRESPAHEKHLAREAPSGAAARRITLPPEPELTGASSLQPLGGVIPEPAIRGSDRRIFVRRWFPHKQFVAPYQGGCLPNGKLFREVTCQDVSAAGFSFLSSHPPEFDALVVALGVAPDMTYMTARVVNRIKIADDPAPLYRIGCRFSGRIS